MPRARIVVSELIAATAPRIYERLADYRDGHPHILPPRYFRNLVVEQGGRGAGTIIRFEFLLGNQAYRCRAEG